VSLQSIPTISAMFTQLIQHSEVENPMLILIMGCVGLTLNIISVTFLHGMKLLHSSTDRAKLKHEPLEHDHDHEGTNELPAAAEADNNTELSTQQDVSAMLAIQNISRLR